MTDPDRSLLKAILRNDFFSFAQRCFQTVVPGQPYLPNWHLDAMAYQLDRVRNGSNRHLIITVPPRNGKSILTSVAFPAFLLGHDPTARIVCASYSQDLASKHARDCRTVMMSSWYQELFPRTRIDKRKNTESEFETIDHGYRLATSVGGTLTGRGGNYIIIDDPIKPEDALSESRRSSAAEWYDSTLSSRLDSKTEGSIILIMQRLHEYDLVAHLKEKDIAWIHLNLPAIALEDESIEIGPNEVYERKAGQVLHAAREPQPVLDEIRASMGHLNFSAQYQQAPVPVEGNLIKREWFRQYRAPFVPESGDKLFQSWDTASVAGKTNDYSVCTIWAVRAKSFYLIDVVRGRFEFPDLRNQILAQARRMKGSRVLIEDAGSGIGLIQDLKRTGGVRATGIRPDRDKTARLESASLVVEAGDVYLPDFAPWLDEFLNELLAFPNGRFDDQVDSFSQFLIWYPNRPRVTA